MALPDDLQRIASVQGAENAIIALRCARWIFERNPDLSLAQQAEGIAFLIAAFLRETETRVRAQYVRIIRQIIHTRPYQVGAQIDWAALINALPQLPSEEAGLVLYLLRYATDERYLSLLERYFDDIDQYAWAVPSWVILAYTQRYTYDRQVLPPLQGAQKVIEDRFYHARVQLQRKLRKVALTREDYLLHEPWFRFARAWARQQLAGAEKHIRQHIQVRDRTAYMREYEEQKLAQTEPDYLPTRIQRWLALPTGEEKIEAGLGLLGEEHVEYFLYYPVDEVARSVKVLMDYAFAGEDTSVRGPIWRAIGMAFQAHRYAGTYLDWDRLMDVLLSLHKDKESSEYRAFFYQLSESRKDTEERHLPASLLSCMSYAPDERALNVMKLYLDHSDVYIRWAAVRAIENLLCHLAHYCPEAILLLQETCDILKTDWKTPIPPERWQVIKDRLEQFEHDVRQYFHYYSI